MHDAHGSAGGSRIRRRFRNKGPMGISPSFGVRNGFMADVERPLPAGEKAKRKGPRIPTSFRIKIGEAWHRVAGDVSAGGLLILYPEQILVDEVAVSIELRDGSGVWNATCEILRCVPRGQRFAHHIRFANLAQVEGLGQAIERALAAGETRLATV
jgi:hypothetical protein